MSWDIENICRTCLASSGPMMSIFKETSLNSSNVCMADILNCFTSIDFESNSEMPEGICHSCVSEINRCYAFKIKCEMSNNSLLYLLSDAAQKEKLISDDRSILNSEDMETNTIALKNEMHNSKDFVEFEDEPEDFYESTEEQEQNADESNEDSKDVYSPTKAKVRKPHTVNLKNIELIKEISKYEYIYNPIHKDNRNISKRIKAWQAISKALQRPEKACQKRWKSIRDQHKRLTKSDDKEKFLRWPLRKYLQFLSDSKDKADVKYKNDLEVVTQDTLSSSQLDIKLLQEIKKFKCIYEYNTDRSKEKVSLKSEAWQEISKKMNMSVSACQKRWKSIHSHYIRLVKSDDKEKSIRWLLMKYLQFLTDAICEADPEYIDSDNEDENTSSNQTIELIKEIKKYKCIYDKDFERNRENKFIRLEAWQEIGMKMNLSANLLKKRWKSLRDRYVKMYKCASENDEWDIDSRWEMAKYLYFLDDHIGQERPTTSKMEIPFDCEPIEVEVTEITYGSDYEDK